MPECPACRAPQPEDARFCARCGAALSPDGEAVTYLAGHASSDPDAPTVLPPGRVSASPIASGPGSGPRSPSGPVSPDFGPGTFFAGRYRIVALLGRGGMGEVWRADDLKLGQPVALKFLPRALERDPTRLERFLGEVRTAREVSHPNVCRVHDVGEAEDRHFLSMEYIDGEDLASLLRRIGRLPPDKALDIARQLAAGLAAAHDKGVLHRDLKPANVMLDGRGKVRLTDFGLAAAASTEGVRGEVAGTPAFMAPEQFAGRPATVQTDLYALGLVLYQIFTGKPAFEAATFDELRRLHEESRPPDLSSAVRDIDPAVERVILQCLEKDPRNRPASAIAVAAALPGGDPLAAALAAGQTPSPAMVAAAGEDRGLGLVPATVALLVVVAGLVLVAFMTARVSALARLPLDYSPDVLEVKARELLLSLGYPSGGPSLPARGSYGAAAPNPSTPAPVVDSARGLAWDEAYRRYAVARGRVPGRWRELRSGRVLLRFWYRGSPVHLEPQRFAGGQFVGGTSVTLTDPPLDVAGMTAVELDARAHLLRLTAVPPQVDPPGPSDPVPVDWQPLLDAFGVDPGSPVAVPSQWTPPVWADTRAAWTATCADLPGIPLRIEAAAYRGKPVYAEIVAPWTHPGRDEASAVSTSQTAGEVIATGVLLILLFGGAVLAWRNILLSRGDRRGASRLALVTLAIFFGSWVLEAHHVPTAGELLLAVKGFCWALFAAGFVWVLYLALEPPLRRHWPHTLIAWSRLLAGRVSDPLVGRDVLIGSVSGVLLALLAFLPRIGAAWFGQVPPAPTNPPLAPLLGLRYVLPSFFSFVFNATFGVLEMFFLLFLLRLAFRRAWAIVAVFVILAGLQAGLIGENFTIDAAGGLLVGALEVFVLLRFGLVAFAVSIFFTTTLTTFPLSAHVLTWYGAPSVPALLLLGVVAAYGFRMALAGRSLLGATERP